MQYPYVPTSENQESAPLGSDGRAVAPATHGQPNEGGTSACDSERAQEAEAPRLVIRGENPSNTQNSVEAFEVHSKQPNPKAAFIDWLNFSFPFAPTSGDRIRDIDVQFREAFGFGLTGDRFKKHLNYERSWTLGEDCGIFATGGTSVGGTSLVSISGIGCAAVKDWTKVYYLLKELKAKITRIDLAHDDFLGSHDVFLAKEWWENGRFDPPFGRPPNAELIDDLGSDKGKTFYVGSRKSGKLLRVYEKGKQLGDPNSRWVRWECELHAEDRILKLEMIISPGTHLAGT